MLWKKGGLELWPSVSFLMSSRSHTNRLKFFFHIARDCEKIFSIRKWLFFLLFCVKNCVEVTATRCVYVKACTWLIHFKSDLWELKKILIIFSTLYKGNSIKRVKISHCICRRSVVHCERLFLSLQLKILLQLTFA